ncbi:trigger factor [Bacteriovoracaceae bacterium]|nr:trigger factor [Bacteriovoracaceae bacterium]|tara:strand:- start:204375 stop:205652 length:1278 start_codon:yes stop_codon:yes gene_type:complete
MSYSLENINGCTKKLVFKFDTLDLSSQIKVELSKKQRSVSLKGFRKGKAPLAMVEKMYGPQIENEALNSFIQSQLYEAVSKEELRVVGYPKFENMKYESGNSVSFDALVEIFPEVELKDMSGLSFTEEKADVAKEDIDNTIKGYLASKAEMKEVEGGALANGQFAVLNFEGEKEDGSRPANMKGEEFLLEIGSGQFIPGFEEGMVGMKKDEEKVIELTFPEDYQAQDLQGAKVKFHTKLLEIKEKSFPEMTEEIAKELGFESVSDMEEKTKKNLLDQKQRQSKEKLHQEILETLVKENAFDVPQTLIDQQKNHIQEDVKRNLAQQGFNEQMMDEYFAKWNEDIDGKAVFQVKSGLILDKLGKDFGVEASEEDFTAKLQEIADSSGIPLEQIKGYYTGDAKMKNNLMYAVREEKTFDKIREKVTIK